ncbi:PAS domain-containing protein [Neptuniibacter sp. QD37_11]|uniref:PAS domain-containing protein n=1 Tax=Neptuniibacter sp. QD37_11 TaxID=3398209 RepID=UPI0039F59B71
MHAAPSFTAYKIKTTVLIALSFLLSGGLTWWYSNVQNDELLFSYQITKLEDKIDVIKHFSERSIKDQAQLISRHYDGISSSGIDAAEIEAYQALAKALKVPYIDLIVPNHYYRYSQEYVDSPDFTVHSEPAKAYRKLSSFFRYNEKGYTLAKNPKTSEFAFAYQVKDEGRKADAFLLIPADESLYFPKEIFENSTVGAYLLGNEVSITHKTRSSLSISSFTHFTLSTSTRTPIRDITKLIAAAKGELVKEKSFKFVAHSGLDKYAGLITTLNGTKTLIMLIEPMAVLPVAHTQGEAAYYALAYFALGLFIVALSAMIGRVHLTKLFGKVTKKVEESVAEGACISVNYPHVDEVGEMLYVIESSLNGLIKKGIANNKVLKEARAEYDSALSLRKVVFDLASAPMIVLTQDYVISEANRKAVSFLGKDKIDLIGQSPSIFFLNYDEFLEVTAAMLGGREGSRWKEVIHIKKIDGSPVWVQIEERPYYEADKVVGYVWEFRDMTETRALRQSIYLQNQISQTGVYIKVTEFLTSLDREISRSVRVKAVVTVLSIDFKGKANVELYQLAEVAKNSLRSSDFCGYFNGDSIVIALSETEEESFNNLTHRMTAAFREAGLYSSVTVFYKFATTKSKVTSEVLYQHCLEGEQSSKIGITKISV